ncbi:MAG TPA: HigA family addiction module antitoxin [Alphaproteobacteria bacterium]|nr:HigA family addiction module antitoxin [Alphaproteobacteria bacterium]
MAEYRAERNPNWPPTHPGELLRKDVLPAMGVTVSEAAREMKISRQALHAILSGRAAVTPAMALRLGKFCGNGPDLWLRMQQARDLWEAERSLADEIKRIPTRSAA